MLAVDVGVGVGVVITLLAEVRKPTNWPSELMGGALSPLATDPDETAFTGPSPAASMLTSCVVPLTRS